MVNCIMLIDDNADDNFYHERIIRKNSAAKQVIVKQSGIEALDHLKSGPNTRPDLIFLDINMPGMNGWEFLREYEKLDQQLMSNVIVVMLTTSDNPDDYNKAKTLAVPCDFKTKPLSGEMLEEIIGKYCK